MERTDWRSHGLLVTHTCTHFDGKRTHHGVARANVVRLHFGLRGDYSVTYPAIGRSFEEMFGATVYVYLTEQRLETARRALLDTDKTAAEVAFELGYATPQHFHSAFKKRFGVTPNSVRKAP